MRYPISPTSAVNHLHHERITPRIKNRRNTQQGTRREERQPHKQPSQSYPLTFNNLDTEGLDAPHNDPLVITLTITDFEISRILVNTGNSVDVIFKDTLKKMDIDECSIKPKANPLISFAEDNTILERHCQAPSIRGEHPQNSQIQTDHLQRNLQNPLDPLDEGDTINLPPVYQNHVTGWRVYDQREPKCVKSMFPSRTKNPRAKRTARRQRQDFKSQTSMMKENVSKGAKDKPYCSGENEERSLRRSNPTSGRQRRPN